ncbi:MAG: FeoB-associated Cys-rich membrane protein [Clostridia bacterium]|nr:FeoB-associated Cys-rich membrane protein [[Bacteroides] pectinophilus]MDD5873227.1 FeoB-associated Cys-rich membrane protein [Clostridia bacterium]
MDILSIIILVLLAIWFVAAVIYMIKNKGGCSCGGSSCGSCTDCKNGCGGCNGCKRCNPSERG